MAKPLFVSGSASSLLLLLLISPLVFSTLPPPSVQVNGSFDFFFLWSFIITLWLALFVFSLFAVSFLLSNFSVVFCCESILIAVSFPCGFGC